MMKNVKSLCTWWLQYSRQVHRDFLITLYIGLHVKYPLFLFDFNEKWIFSTDF